MTTPDAEMPPDDVLEAMAKAHHDSFYTHVPIKPTVTWNELSPERRAEEIYDMKAALSCPEYKAWRKSRTPSPSVERMLLMKCKNVIEDLKDGYLEQSGCGNHTFPEADIVLAALEKMEGER